MFKNAVIRLNQPPLCAPGAEHGRPIRLTVMGLAMVLAFTPSVWAADPKTDAKTETKPEAKADAKADAEAAAAMERARRQASNPMRVILEASKVRRKPGEDGPAPVAAPATTGNAAVPSATAAARSLPSTASTTSTAAPAALGAASPSDAAIAAARAAAVRSGTAPGLAGLPAVRETAGAVAATAAASRAATGSPPSGASSPVAVAAAPSGPVGSGSLTAPVSVPAGLPEAPGTGAAAAVATRTAPPNPASLPNTANATAAPAAATRPLVPSPAPSETASASPKLLEMVEPSIPQRVLDEVGRLVELSIDVTIRADGTVAAVNVLPPAPRPMVRYVVAAVERWRFAPLPAQSVHRVQLVFNER